MLGLDVGEVRIGVALSDETSLIAQAISTLQRVSWKKDLQALLEMAEQYDTERIVVGHPINLDGTAGRQAEMVRDFVRRLKEFTSLEVVLWDERFSSFSAEKALIEGGVRRAKRKQVIDKVAAAIILQNYLDHLHTQRAIIKTALSEDDGSP